MKPDAQMNSCSQCGCDGDVRVGSRSGPSSSVGRMDGTFVKPAEGKEMMLGVDGGIRGCTSCSEGPVLANQVRNELSSLTDVLARACESPSEELRLRTLLFAMFARTVTHEKQEGHICLFVCLHLFFFCIYFFWFVYLFLVCIYVKCD